MDPHGNRFTQALPDVVHLDVGQHLQVPLTGAVGGGYSWTVSVEPDDGVVRARIVSLPPAPVSSPPGGVPPGTTTMSERLDVTARAAGTTRLEMALTRSWQSGEPLARQRITVHVADPDSDPDAGRDGGAGVR